MGKDTHKEISFYYSFYPKTIAFEITYYKLSTEKAIDKIQEICKKNKLDIELFINKVLQSLEYSIIKFENDILKWEKAIKEKGLVPK